MHHHILLNEISEGEIYLSRSDPALAVLIAKQQPLLIVSRGNYFYSLCRSIIGQQISTVAARAIFNRFDTIGGTDPEKLLTLSDIRLREIGLSGQKISYLKDLASHFIKNQNIYNHLETLSDDEIINHLISIRGIGIWTAQMFLMFSLHRLDVFAVDDNGIQRAMINLYEWTTRPSKKELIDYVQHWKPYRTIACWHLWKSLE